MNELLKALEDKLGDSDVITFNGPIIFGVDDIIRSVVEQKRQEKPNRDRLSVILTTNGGYIEVVQRIVDTLRYHYPQHVEFVIPNYAFSAGTVLVMSGDRIYMDYYSRLGPIDPQVPTANGQMVPALGYLHRYEDLLRKAQQNKLSTAEAQLLIAGFDQAELYKYEQARELSITLLKQWLANYKFKNWQYTETRKIAVTKAMKTRRAASIAESLNNTKKWHVHGHGISMDVLRKDLRLVIDDFGKIPELNEKIKDYSSLMSDYMAKKGETGVLQTIGVYIPFLGGL
ncbi:MAG: serine dehydrogenasease [Dehalococcoidia bacterium]|nr:serine dehydrogenasease [Dehalococcoidia bacterium]